jgi:hypothetical protein
MNSNVNYNIKRLLTESANGGAGLPDDFSQYEAQAAQYYAQTYGSGEQKKNDVMNPNINVA